MFSMLRGWCLIVMALLAALLGEIAWNGDWLIVLSSERSFSCRLLSFESSLVILISVLENAIEFEFDDSGLIKTGD